MGQHGRKGSREGDARDRPRVPLPLPRSHRRILPPFSGRGVGRSPMICRMCPPRLNFFLSVACLLTLPAFARSVTAAAVSATKLDGSTVSGELRKWDTTELQLATAAGDQQIPTKQLASLRW